MPTIRQFIAEEVSRQGFKTGGKAHILRCAWMREAWSFARTAYNLGVHTVCESDVLLLAKMIEKEDNRKGYRQVPVVVGPNATPTPKPEDVPRLMAALFESIALYSPDEFYLEFQKIHPFKDGNGRVGKIIHNWMSGTLDNPILVQDFFGTGTP